MCLTVCTVFTRALRRKLASTNVDENVKYQDRGVL